MSISKVVDDATTDDSREVLVRESHHLIRPHPLQNADSPRLISRKKLRKEIAEHFAEGGNHLRVGSFRHIGRGL